jgi:hypothetical protein
MKKGSGLPLTHIIIEQESKAGLTPLIFAGGFCFSAIFSRSGGKMKNGFVHPPDN